MLPNPGYSIRRPARKWPLYLALILLLVSLRGTLCFAQSPKPTEPQSSNQTSAPASEEAPNSDLKKDVKPEKDAKPAEPPAAPESQPTGPVDPAQAELMSDTAKLVKLSEELKAEVAKSNKDTLSLAVIKKAEEVEKLAKSLKERMNKAH